MLLAADGSAICIVGREKSATIEYEGPTESAVEALLSGNRDRLRGTFGSGADDISLALSEVLPGVDLRAAARSARHRTDSARMELHRLLCDAEGLEEFGGPALVVAGRDLLTVASGVERSEALESLRIWVSRLRPAARLKAYASVASGKEVVLVPLESPPGDEPAMHPGVNAWTYEGGSWRHAGSAVGGRAVGCLAAAEVQGTIPVRLAQRSLHVAHGVAACPNLSFVGLAGDDDPVEACIGVGATEALARSKCHGEGVERFRLGDADPLRLVSAAASELEVAYLAGDAFFAYRSEQRERLGLEPYSPEAVERWITGFRWDGTRVAVPACLVWCPFPQPRWLAHGAQSSNGAAAWGGLREARRRAWLELVERDAFIRMWRTEAVPERIMAEGLAAEMRDWLSQRGVDSFILKLDGAFEVPVACAIGISDSHLCIGAAAGSAGEIVEKAMSEVVMQHLFPVTTQVEAKDVSTPSDHAAFWSHRRDKDLERVLSGPEVAEQEDEGMNATESIDSDAVFVTLANHPVVVKALSPNLVPMTFGFDAEPLASYRSAFGFDQAGPLTPHPFA